MFTCSIPKDWFPQFLATNHGIFQVDLPLAVIGQSVWRRFVGMAYCEFGEITSELFKELKDV